MKNNLSIIGRTHLLAALALGLAVSASAQSLQSPSSPPAPAASAPLQSASGLLGGTYGQFQLGYEKEDGGIPGVLHDYDFLYNQALFKSGDLGTDINLNYDYLTGHAFGAHDYRNEATAGFTEYLLQAWGDPFVTGNFGEAWQRADNVGRKSFAYSFTGGVEFPIVKDLALTPFVEYQAEPQLYNHELPYAFMPDHDWYTGVKATYRLTPQWSVSVTADMDQYSSQDLGFFGGLTMHF
jgi:hypothetical protein